MAATLDTPAPVMAPYNPGHGALRRLEKALVEVQKAQENARRFHPAYFGDNDPKWCFADFLVTVGKTASQKTRGAARNRLENVYKTALNYLSGVTGGYLVPSPLADDLLRTVEEESIFRRRGALVLPMEFTSLQVALPDATTPQAAGVAPFFGGLNLKWIAEGDSFGETEPTWRQVEFDAKVLGGVAYASNNWLNDSGRTLETYLRRMFGSASAYYQDYFFFNGLGVGQPTGLTGNGNMTLLHAIYVARTASGHFREIDAAKMLQSLLPSCYENAIWAIHPSAVIDLFQLQNTAATPVITYVPNQYNGPGEGQDTVGFLGGRPVLVSSKLQTLGTQGDLVLFDPRLYAIGDRETLEIAASEHVQFTTNQTVYRIMSRLDGQPWFSKSITLPDATTLVSPYVCLQ